jgi:hypothetical protein
MSKTWRHHLSSLWTRSEKREQPITFHAELRSCHPHIAFDATFQFWWRGSDQAAYWAERQKITELAGNVTVQYVVTQAGNAENEINTSNIHNTRVQLGVNPRARAAAEAMLEIDRQAALEHLRQRAELERIRYLRESIYSHPDVARRYWLYHHPDQLTAMLGIDFEEIAEKFAGAAESRFLVIAKLISDFFGRLEDGDRRYLVGQLGQFFSSYDRPDLAEQLEAS